MWIIPYYLLLSVAALLYLPLWLARSWGRGQWRWPLLRLGLWPQNLRGLAAGGIWIHALSVGEVASALPLARALGEGERPLYFSVATRAGYQLAQRELPGWALLVRPLDVPWALNAWIKALKPRLFVLVESDMWPGWQRSLSRAGVFSALVNARVSPRTFARYRRAPFLARLLYADFDLICAQSDLDAHRLRAIGRLQRAEVYGNLKFDSLPAPLSRQQARELRQRLGLEGRRTLLAGSTHPGEEEICARVFRQLAFPGLALVIAPRDIARARRIQALIPGAWSYSQGPLPADKNILILDVMGLLAQVYALAAAAFVGGSLAAAGGHNPLEAAIQGTPAAFGPHMEDFAQIAQEMRQWGAAVEVVDGDGLRRMWEDCLQNPEAAAQRGRRGREFCQAQSGAAARIMARIRDGENWKFAPGKQ
jgi:3-deoxy-D-manno-octulosonic-acid transferase